MRNFDNLLTHPNNINIKGFHFYGNKFEEFFSCQGLSECSWSSCREGCTGDIYTCHQIHVEYQPLSGVTGAVVTATSATNSATLKASSATRRSQLKITPKGCGYPPTVNCSQWTSEFGQNNSKFPCYYSE